MPRRLNPYDLVHASEPFPLLCIQFRELPISRQTLRLQEGGSPREVRVDNLCHHLLGDLVGERLRQDNPQVNQETLTYEKRRDIKGDGRHLSIV